MSTKETRRLIMKIKIKYFNKDYPRLKKIEQGDWIDLRME